MKERTYKRKMNDKKENQDEYIEDFSSGFFEGYSQAIKDVEKMIDEIEYDCDDRSVVNYHELKQKLKELKKNER